MISPFLKYKTLKNRADKPNARAQHFLWRTAKITAGKLDESDVEIEWIYAVDFPEKRHIRICSGGKRGGGFVDGSEEAPQPQHDRRQGFLQQMPDVFPHPTGNPVPVFNDQIDPQQLRRNAQNYPHQRRFFLQ